MAYFKKLFQDLPVRAEISENPQDSWLKLGSSHVNIWGYTGSDDRMINE
jgi:hypothetical protein